MKVVLQNWNKEEFRSFFHEASLFIRETELVHLDEHVENIHKFVTKEDGAVEAMSRSTLMH
jgi:hypothetical protein